jgi:hypothetical protein
MVGGTQEASSNSLQCSANRSEILIGVGGDVAMNRDVARLGIRRQVHDRTDNKNYTSLAAARSVQHQGLATLRTLPGAPNM